MFPRETVSVRAPTSNWNRLVRTEEPAVTAIDRAAAKQHLLIEEDEASFDEQVDQMVNDAIAQIEGPKGVGLALITQTWRLSLDHWCGGISIPLRPVQSIVSVKYRDLSGVEQTLDPALYDADLDHEPFLIVPAFTAIWPQHKIGRGVIKVTFTAGFGDAATDVPADIIGALKLIIGHRFKNREAVVGVDNRDSSAPLPMGVADVFARYVAGPIA